ncbi:MAG: 50S ribosomal protein L6 [Bacteroidetes bacterium CG2_30_33_31]|nr:MAG: 50S ribosomal protein L6 [Bacteroidetes bacterium CG2_30_33_31]
MSRIGKLPIDIPAGVEIKLTDGNINVRGTLGTLSQSFDDSVNVKIEGKQIIVERNSESNDHRAKHGLYRSLIHNMVLGVSTGFKTVQELVGVGYRASNTGQLLDLSLGYSHHIYFLIPDEVKVETENAKGKNPLIILTSADKQLIGQVAAKIRSLRKPEPYKGKGVKFQGEVLRRKAGKTASK